MDPTIAAEQLRIMQEINATLQQQRGLLTGISNSMTQQAGAFNSAASAGAGYTDSMNNVTSATQAAGNAADKSRSAWDMMTETMDGFTNNIPGPLQDALSLLKTNITSLKDAIMNPFAAAVGFLERSFTTLLEQAVKYGEELIKVSNRLEQVREKFGSFAETSSARIKEVAFTSSKTLKEAAGGANVFASKFNMGIDGVVDRIDAAQESFEALGAMTDAVGQQFVESADEIFVLRKGLAFSDEAIQQTARLAMLGNQSIQSFSQSMMKNIDQIGRAFGISTKVLGKDVGSALSNFKLLGKMTGDYVKEMVKGATFTRKLGFEIEKLTGLVDKFDDFEQGAEAAAQLAQGFGLVLDPLKMMNMQDPAGRLQEVQRAFAATGRSIESMHRQERALLASTTGLDEAILSQALSAQGMSMSYDQIKDAAEGATKNQKTNEEVMRDLADNIQNFIRPFQAVASFIESFIDGIMYGLTNTRDFTKLLGTLATALQLSFKIGEAVGRVLSRMFFVSDDGKKFVGFITNISEMFTGIFGDIKGFVNLLKTGGAELNISDEIGKLIGGIFTRIQNTFNSGPGAMDFASMINRVGMIFFNVLNGAVKWLLGPDGLKKISAQIRGAFKGTDESSLAGGLLSGFGAALTEFVTLIPQLQEPITELVYALFEALGDLLTNFPFATMFVAGGPIMVTLTGIVSSFFGALGGLFSGAADGGGGAGIAQAADQVTAGIEGGMTGAIVNVVEKSTGLLDRLVGIIEQPAKIAATATAIAYGIVEIGAAIRKVLLSFMEPEGSSFVDTVVNMAGKFESVKWENLLSLGAVLAMVFGSIALVGAAVAAAASQISAGTGIMMLIGAVAFAPMIPAALMGGAVGVAGALYALSRIIGDIMKAIAEPFSDKAFLTNLSVMGRMLPQVRALGELGGVLTSLITSIIAIQDAVPNKGLLGFGDDDFDSLTTTVEQVVDFIVGGGKGDKFKGGLLTVLKRIPPGADVSSQIGTIQNIAQVTQGLLPTINFIKNMATADLDKAISQIPALGTTIDGIVEFMGGMPDTLGSMVNMNPDFMNQKAGSVDQIFNFVDNFVDRMELSAGRASDEKLDQFADRVRAIVSKTTEIRKILEELDTIPLNATLDKLGNNMKLAKTTMSIAGGAVKVNVQMNVTMNAEKLAGQMVMNGYVSAPQEFQDYLQTKDGVGEEFETGSKTRYRYGGKLGDGEALGALE